MWPCPVLNHLPLAAYISFPEVFFSVNIIVVGVGVVVVIFHILFLCSSTSSSSSLLYLSASPTTPPTSTSTSSSPPRLQQQSSHLQRDGIRQRGRDHRGSCGGAGLFLGSGRWLRGAQQWLVELEEARRESKEISVTVVLVSVVVVLAFVMMVMVMVMVWQAELS